MGAASSAPRTPALDAADVERVRAEAAAVTKRADAEAAAVTKRADAEAAVAAKRADAEAMRAHAEAAVAARRGDIEAAAARLERGRVLARTATRYVALGMLGAGACYLYLDYLYHDDEPTMKERMKDRLRRCPVPSNALQVPSTAPFAVRQEPLTLTSKPTLLLGPTGCGKSSLLRKIARESASPPPGSSKPPAPTVLINIRVPTIDASKLREATQNDAEAITLMNASAFRIWNAIGFPTRASWISRIRDLKVDMQGVSASISRAPTTDRLLMSLRLLFEACAELAREREKAGMSARDAACVVLIDEAQDLVKDQRLASVGGREVLRMLATLIVVHGVDMPSVRAVLAGSSALLAVELRDCSGLATASRVRLFELADPEPGHVRRRLEECGYTAEDAKRIVDLCGTRLRWLDELFDSTLPRNVNAWLGNQRDAAKADIAGAFQSLPDDERPIFASVLDRIAAEQQPHVAAGADPRTVNLDELKRLLPSIRISSAGLSQAAYLDKRYHLRFQSQLHRAVWPEVRGMYGLPAARGTPAPAQLK